jgi:hypothetical protein
MTKPQIPRGVFRSRLQSICEDPDNPLSLADDVYDDGPTFKDSSLKEEPESLQVMKFRVKCLGLILRRRTRIPPGDEV